mmetsp:Transcript_140631/g.448428  ORF Transcript_140631/g.448428 Transcript_140631/m.448428 type:complete len:269 (+) Transcript_140631:2-808(+)
MVFGSSYFCPGVAQASYASRTDEMAIAPSSFCSKREWEDWSQQAGSRVWNLQSRTEGAAPASEAMHSDAVREALDQASASLLAAIARGSGPSSGAGRPATAAQRRAEQANLKHSPLSMLYCADEYLNELSKHREALVRQPLGSPSSCTTKASEGEGEAPEAFHSHSLTMAMAPTITLSNTDTEVGPSLSLQVLDGWRRKAPTEETDDDEQVSIAGTSCYVDVPEPIGTPSAFREEPGMLPEWLVRVTPLTSPLLSRSELVPLATAPSA